MLNRTVVKDIQKENAFEELAWALPDLEQNELFKFLWRTTAMEEDERMRAPPVRPIAMNKKRTPKYYLRTDLILANEMADRDPQFFLEAKE